MGDGFCTVVAMGKGDLPCNFGEHGGRLAGWKVEKVEIDFVCEAVDELFVLSMDVLK